MSQVRGTVFSIKLTRRNAIIIGSFERRRDTHSKTPPVSKRSPVGSKLSQGKKSIQHERVPNFEEFGFKVGPSLCQK